MGFDFEEALQLLYENDVVGHRDICDWVRFPLFSPRMRCNVHMFRQRWTSRTSFVCCPSPSPGITRMSPKSFIHYSTPAPQRTRYAPNSALCSSENSPPLQTQRAVSPSLCYEMPRNPRMPRLRSQASPSQFSKCKAFCPSLWRTMLACSLSSRSSFRAGLVSRLSAHSAAAKRHSLHSFLCAGMPKVLLALAAILQFMYQQDVLSE